MAARGGQRTRPLHGRPGRAARRRRLRRGGRGRRRVHPSWTADLRRAGRPLRRDHLRPRAGRPRAGGRAGRGRGRWSGPARRPSRWRSTRPTCARASTRPACRFPPTPVVRRGPPRPLDAVDRLRRRPRLARHPQGGPRRLRRQGRLARRRPGEAAAVLARRRGTARRSKSCVPLRGRAGRHGRPPPLGRGGRLAGGRDRPGRRGLPGGARAGTAARRRARGRLGPRPEGGRGRRRRRRPRRRALLVRRGACWSTRSPPGPTTRGTGRSKAR